MRQCASEQVLRKVKVFKILTHGDILWKGRVDGVVVEGKGSEILKATEEGRKRAANVSVGEVKGSNRMRAWVASDTKPGTRSVIAGVVPGGKGGVRVGKAELNVLEIETFLVEGKS